MGKDNDYNRLLDGDYRMQVHYDFEDLVGHILPFIIVTYCYARLQEVEIL